MKKSSESTSWLKKTALALSCIGALQAPQAVAHDISNISAAQVQAMNQALQYHGFTPLDNVSAEQQKMHRALCNEYKNNNPSYEKPKDCIFVGYKIPFFGPKNRAYEAESAMRISIMGVIQQNIGKRVFEIGSINTGEKHAIFMVGTR